MEQITAKAGEILSSRKAVPAKGNGHDPVSMKGYSVGTPVFALAFGKDVPEAVVKAIASWK
jgi:hypothetical protein